MFTPAVSDTSQLDQLRLVAIDVTDGRLRTAPEGTFRTYAARLERPRQIGNCAPRSCLPCVSVTPCHLQARMGWTIFPAWAGKTVLAEPRSTARLGGWVQDMKPGTHSVCRGAARALLESGGSLSQLFRAGRRHSSAYKLYIWGGRARRPYPPCRRMPPTTSSGAARRAAFS